MSRRDIIRLAVTESTNSEALALGEKGARSGTVVVAEMQTGGRGRLNRPWLSQQGMGLYFSIITKPKLAARGPAKNYPGGWAGNLQNRGGRVFPFAAVKMAQ